MGYKDLPLDFRHLDFAQRPQWIRTRLESQNLWREAAECWKSLGEEYVDNYKACKLLYCATTWGDNYRAGTKKIIAQIQELESKIANQEFSNIVEVTKAGQQIIELHNKLNEIYANYYGKQATEKYNLFVQSLPF